LEILIPDEVDGDPARIFPSLIRGIVAADTEKPGLDGRRSGSMSCHLLLLDFTRMSLCVPMANLDLFRWAFLRLSFKLFGLLTTILTHI